MPQKKNPDVAELARGKSGRIIGNLTGCLATMKGLPLSYNLDMQEDKEAVFDVEDNLIPAIHALDGLFSSMDITEHNMLRLASMGNSSATDLADYLVAKGVNFREAHGIVGRIVQDCESHSTDLTSITLEVLRKHSPVFSDDALERLKPNWSVSARKSPAGTAPSNVASAIAQSQSRIKTTLATWSALHIPTAPYPSNEL